MINMDSMLFLPRYHMNVDFVQMNIVAIAKMTTQFVLNVIKITFFINSHVKDKESAHQELSKTKP